MQRSRAALAIASLAVLALALVCAHRSALAQDQGEDDGPPDAAQGKAEPQGDDGDDEPLLPKIPSADVPRKAIDPKEVTKKAAPARRKELSKDAYRFCHDPEFGKQGTDGLDFCLIFDATSDEVCPEARKHCKEWRAMRGLCEDLSDQQCRDLLLGKHGKSRVVRDTPNPFAIQIPAAVSWAIIGGIGLLALFWFVRALRQAGWESNDRDEDAAAAMTDAERNLQALPEARSTALLKLAERALARGEEADAAILLHLAVLRHLDDTGLARYHPSKTNGDYLRAIRPHKPLAALFRAVARETERLRFGDGQTDGEALRGLLDEARRVLDERPSAPVPEPSAGPATLAVIALLSLTQTACPQSSNDPAYHSRGPAGMAALPEVLREAGLTVEISRSRLASLPGDVGVVVIRSSAASGKQWPSNLRIDSTLDKNISVVVIDDLWNQRFFMPVTATATPPRRAVDVAVEAPDPEVFCTWRLGELAAIPPTGADAIHLPEGRRLVTIPDATTATVSAKQLRIAPILTYAGDTRLLDPTTKVERTAAVAFAADRVEHGTSLAGCLYMFADRDVFTNASLTREPNVRFAVAFFAALAKDGRKIVLLDRLDPFTASSSSSSSDGSEGEDKKDNPAKSLRASNLLAFIAQAGLLLIAFFLAVGAAFGPLRDPVVREHKAFVEHVEAIGRQYARTGLMGLTHSARALARLVVMRNRDLVRGGTGSGWSGVAQHLAHKHELDEKDVRAALRLGFDGTTDLGQPSPEDPTPSSDRMLRTLSRLLGGRELPKHRVGRAAEKRTTSAEPGTNTGSTRSADSADDRQNDGKGAPTARP